MVDCLEALLAGIDELITLRPFERSYFLTDSDPRFPSLKPRGYLFGTDFWGAAESLMQDRF